MNTTKKLHIGMMATAAAVALLTGCQRREEGDVTTVTPPPASSTAPAPSTSPGTSGYTGPATGDTSSSSSSSMSTPPQGSAGAPGGSSSSSMSSSTDTAAPGTSGYVGGSSPSGSTSGSSGGAEATVTDQDRERSGASGSGTSGSGTSGSGTSGSSGSSSNTGPTSSLDRPFRDVAVAGPGDARGPAAWREALGVQVLRVADADKAMMDKTGGKLSKKDESFIKKAATGGMFEVEAARLAAEKATDPQLKTFAEKLRDQHQQANDELKQIASARGMTMPTQMPAKEKAMLDKLNKASGDKFDKEFISMVGLRDHKQDIREFENARNETTDTELKAWIEKTLPTLRTHLAEAQQMSGHEGMKMQGYTGSEQEKQQGYTGSQDQQQGSTAKKAKQLDEQRKSGIEGSGVGGSAN